MPRECGKIAQEQSRSERKKEITAEQENEHRKQRATEGRRQESRRDWDKGTDGRKADSQPEQIKEGKRSRRGSEKETQGEGETAREDSRRGCRADDQQTQTANTETERCKAGEPGRSWEDLREIIGRSSNHAQPRRCDQSEAGEAKSGAEHRRSC